MPSLRTIVAAATLTLLQTTQAWNIELPSCLDPFQPYVYAGCFDGHQTTGADTLIYRSSQSYTNMTIEKCVAECKGNGFRYAGLKYYGVCFCGTTVNSKQLDESMCTLPCSGDSTETCGGDAQMSVYQDPTFYTGIRSLLDFKTLGCYTDSGSYRALSYPQSNLDNSNMTPSKCLQSCSDNGFPFAGVEYGGECYCGVVLANSTTLASPLECNMPCNGDLLSTCGGSNRINIYVANDLLSLQPCGYQPGASSIVASTTSMTAAGSATDAGSPTTSTAADSSTTSTAADSSITSTAADSSTTSTAGGSSTTSTAADSSTTSTTAGSSTTSTAAGSSTTSTAAGSSTTSTAAGSSTTSTAAGSSTTSTAAGSSTTSTAAGSSTTSTAAGSSTTSSAVGSSTTSTTSSAAGSTRTTSSTNAATTTTTNGYNPAGNGGSTSTTSTTSSTTARSTTSITSTTTSTTTSKFITTTSTTTGAMCTSTVVLPNTCEYKCGSWCAPSVPDFQSATDCASAYKTCAKNIAACFSSAGWPAALNCFDFSSWCDSINTYCTVGTSGWKDGKCAKLDFLTKNKPSSGNSASTTTSVYPCAATVSSTTVAASASTSCAPAPSNICTQPSSWWYNYGPGNPAGQIDLPLVSCSDLKSDYTSGKPFKLYTNSDSRYCSSYGRTNTPSACADACKAQYDSCVSVYVQSCKSFGGRNYWSKRAAEKEFEAEHPGMEKRYFNIWGSDTASTAQTKCQAQYSDCLNTNKNVNAQTRCQNWGTGY